ncbi:MAG: HTH domain-containing protein [Clostridium sp.]|uniref:HTH domain-containing protein n=1 Tax=Clostridium TaxID=1485 RepID=UPI002902634A|nr:HTH domain-containing protein [Clostridium sp.]MDU1230493.1 HTH domain-containing protein [Clostridium sp.]MDU3090047.1 HTH domain-containing protein [Clostridium sp.]
MEIDSIKTIISTNLNQTEDVIRKDIENLLKNYKIELKSLSKMIGVDYVWLKDYMDGKNKLYDFFSNSVNIGENNEESLKNSNIPNPSHLCNMIFMLSEGIMMVNEDDRVKGVIDVLISEYEISHETLAIYSGLELGDLQSFMNDSNSVSCEKKYKLAVASIFLHYLFKK